MNYLKKTWFWIGTVFIVFGVIGIMIGLFLTGLNEAKAIIESSTVALIFGIIAFIVGGEFSEEKLSSDKEESSKEPETVAE